MYGIGIGESDFRGLRIRKNYYIDKTISIWKRTNKRNIII